MIPLGVKHNKSWFLFLRIFQCFSVCTCDVDLGIITCLPPSCSLAREVLLAGLRSSVSPVPCLVDSLSLTHMPAAHYCPGLDKGRCTLTCFMEQEHGGFSCRNGLEAWSSKLGKLCTHLREFASRRWPEKPCLGAETHESAGHFANGCDGGGLGS